MRVTILIWEHAASVLAQEPSGRLKRVTGGAFGEDGLIPLVAATLGSESYFGQEAICVGYEYPRAQVCVEEQQTLETFLAGLTAALTARYAEDLIEHQILVATRDTEQRLLAIRSACWIIGLTNANIGAAAEPWPPAKVDVQPGHAVIAAGLRGNRLWIGSIIHQSSSLTLVDSVTREMTDQLQAVQPDNLRNDLRRTCHLDHANQSLLKLQGIEIGERTVLPVLTAQGWDLETLASADILRAERDSWRQLGEWCRDYHARVRTIPVDGVYLVQQDQRWFDLRASAAGREIVHEVTGLPVHTIPLESFEWSRADEQAARWPTTLQLSQSQIVIPADTPLPHEFETRIPLAATTSGSLRLQLATLHEDTGEVRPFTQAEFPIPKQEQSAATALLSIRFLLCGLIEMRLRIPQSGLTHLRVFDFRGNALQGLTESQRSGGSAMSGEDGRTHDLMEDVTASPRVPIAGELVSGMRIGGRYDIVECLGAGGMGRVYRVYDQVKQCHVALKVIAPDLVDRPGTQERFVTEAKLAASLSHPNIIKVFDVDIDNCRYFMTLELLHGATLRARMQSQARSRIPLPMEQKLKIARDLLGALAYAHQYLIHLDLKPENIWLSDDGVLKIMDFGLARSAGPGSTRTTQSAGSAYYIAPEQLQGLSVDHRADQYAAAVILYELFCGRIPAGVIEPADEVCNEVPRRISNAIMRALRPSPQDRYSTTEEFLQAFEKPSTFAGFQVSARAIALAACAVVICAGGAILLNKQSLTSLNIPWLQSSNSRELAIKEATFANQLLGQMDSYENDLRARIRGLQEKADRLADVIAGNGTAASGAQQRLSDTNKALQSAQELLYFWMTDIYPSAGRMEMESSKALAEVDMKESRFSKAVGLYTQIRRYAEPRTRALPTLAELLSAKATAHEMASQWTGPGAGELTETQQASQQLVFADTAIDHSQFDSALLAYREAVHRYTVIQKTSEERNAADARLKARTAEASAAAARATRARDEQVREQARAEYLRSGREFNDALHSGGKGPTMIVEAAVPAHSVGNSTGAVSAHYIDSAEFGRFTQLSGYAPAIQYLQALYREAAPTPSGGDAAVTKDDALAYAAWLSGETGFQYSVYNLRRVDDVAVRFEVRRNL